MITEGKLVLKASLLLGMFVPSSVFGQTRTQLSSDLAQRDIVHGNLIQFVENGAWSWFQDERVIVDQQLGQLIVGSMANRDGVGGEEIDGKVRTIHYDLATGRRAIFVHNDLESYGAGDDHNVPALLKKSGGDILAFYAAHNSLNGVEDDRSYYRTFNVKTNAWGNESEYHWWKAMPPNAPGLGGTTYSNLFQLAAEDMDGDGHGRLYNIARVRQSPHIMYSDDNGNTWQYGGQLTKQASRPPSVNYVNGYYKYTSNGVDRIDFIATEFHPRDDNTSAYHAYIQRGRLHDSLGKVIDDNIFDNVGGFDTGPVPSTDDFTQVFQAGKDSNSRCWTIDAQVYPDGTLTALFKARAGGYGSHTVGADDHRFWYARFDPMTKVWATHEVAEAGAQLFPGGETDYTGLGALHPSNPYTIYISTEIDPISHAALAHHEVYKGVTADKGATWNWTVITENSSFDNLRPIVPAWDKDNTAVLWWRGIMDTSHDYDTAVVGLIYRHDERATATQYVDATRANTALIDGTPAGFTGPSAEAGLIDGRWHERSDFGNGQNVFTAGESGDEDAPVIRTTISSLESGTYDVFACFWCDSGEDWCVKAGLSEDDLMLFRKRSSQHAMTDDLNELALNRIGGKGLYRAYVGRVNLETSESVAIYINDDDGDADRAAWYDGVGYARVETE